MMRAGTMREKVTIEREIGVSDGQGGKSLIWQLVARVCARVEPLRGREALQAMQVQDSQLYRVTIRYRSDVVPKMRLVWGARTLNIRAVANLDEHRIYLELTAEAGVGE